MSKLQSVYTWRETPFQNITIQNASFSNPIYNRGQYQLSNLLSTQPLPNWTFETESPSMMIGSGATIFNMSDATSNQYLIASYTITESNILSQNITINTPGLYRIIYYTNGRLAFQITDHNVYLNNLPQIQKTLSIPNSANWTKNTVVVSVSLPGVYKLTIKIFGRNQQVSSFTNFSMYRFRQTIN